MFVQNLFTLKSMADFQPNTIYGYPGGELIGTSNIMMQLEDYSHTHTHTSHTFIIMYFP